MVYPLKALIGELIMLESPIYGLNRFINRVLMGISFLASLQIEFSHRVFECLNISFVKVAKLEILEGYSVVISRGTTHLLASPVS